MKNIARLLQVLPWALLLVVAGAEVGRSLAFAAAPQPSRQPPAPATAPAKPPAKPVARGYFCIDIAPGQEGFEIPPGFVPLTAVIGRGANDAYPQTDVIACRAP